MELRILGALEVEKDGRVVRIAGATQRTLLALLLLHANEPVPRDRLIEAGEAAALLREALALWRGVPFAEIDAPCARRARPPRGAAAASCGSRRPFAAQLALMAWSCSRV
jgi:hypothetical protein